MLAVERRKLILEKVHAEKKVIVSELSKEFDVSEETIRRDLDKLADEGHVIKSYGGAVINEIGSIDLPFNVRWKSNSVGKQKIADLVSRDIKDGEHIFLDASTTAVFIAKNIKQKKHLTVITNSIENLLELSDVSGWDIISTGGLLKAGSMSLLGKKATESIERYNADKVFLSCKGVDILKGVTEGKDETAAIKQNMLDAAKKIYLTVDSSKFDKVAFSTICPLNRIDVVVTDKRPDAKWMETFKKLNIQCIYPKDIQDII
ncbi:MAG: DeoR/GlpR transcriptional regulator [Lachnospiraceae bacterium]|nr:DeoR/GlpR transcriptional regulator [Lachnospiraceae bacterium]